MLDLAISQPTVGVLRDQGFLQGFGIDLGDPNRWGDEDDPRIICNEVTAGNEEGGRKAMETCLAIDEGIDMVYTINEPAAVGAYEALKAIGRENDVTIVSVDGGCPGVADVGSGVIAATSQQYPLLMASLGVEAVKAWADDGTKPENTPGKDFVDTGVSLVAAEPVEGVESISVEEGTDLCWG
jgi:fructose transport system substrate-binding protein